MLKESVEEKPFWLRQPWVVLFDVFKLHKLRPWDVNVSYILTSLLWEMTTRGHIDFAASGVALLSSATLHRIKSELILRLQEPPKTVVEKGEVYLPPPIQLPYRHEYTTTTINDLIENLEKVLRSEMNLKASIGESGLEPLLPMPPVIPDLDKFMVDFEENVEKIYQRIVELAGSEKFIPLSKLASGQKKLDKVRTFFLVLFIACRNMIRLWQREEFGEIYLSLPEDVDAEVGRTDAV